MKGVRVSVLCPSAHHTKTVLLNILYSDFMQDFIIMDGVYKILVVSDLIWVPTLTILLIFGPYFILYY